MKNLVKPIGKITAQNKEFLLITLCPKEAHLNANQTMAIVAVRITPGETHPILRKIICSDPLIEFIPNMREIAIETSDNDGFLPI